MINDVYDVFHFCNGVVGTQYGAAQRDAGDTCLEDGGDVVFGDAANSHHGNRDIGSTHLLDDMTIAVKSQDGGQFLFGGGEAERASADIIG